MIGSQIAQLRQERGMCQAELAALLRISPSAVGMYEQGRRLPSLSMVVRLSRVFGVSTDYLLTGKDPQSMTPPPNTKIQQ
jgi:transcriptional regulator with XRE-family HTH domain